MSYLLDTNVISELRKGARCDRAVASWFAGVPEDSIYLSVLVIGEIRRGIERVRRRDPQSAQTLERWLRRVIREHSSRLIPVDQEIAEEWGRLNVPDPLPVIDGMIAATALVHNLTVVTHNIKDIARTGVACVDPFDTTP